MRNLKEGLDYYRFSEIDFLDVNILKAKALEALTRYRVTVPILSKFPEKEIQIDSNAAYLLLKDYKGESIHLIPFLKVKKPKFPKDKKYEIWIATNTSLQYLLRYLLSQ